MDENFEATERTPAGGVEAEVAAVVDALPRDPPTGPGCRPPSSPGCGVVLRTGTACREAADVALVAEIVRPGHAAYERLLKRTEPFPIRLDVPGLLD